MQGTLEVMHSLTPNQLLAKRADKIAEGERENIFPRERRKERECFLQRE